MLRPARHGCALIALVLTCACSTPTESQPATVVPPVHDLPAPSALVRGIPERALMLRLSADGSRAAYFAPISRDSKLDGYALFVDSTTGHEQLSDAIFNALTLTPPVWRSDGEELALSTTTAKGEGRHATVLAVAAPGRHKLEPRFSPAEGTPWCSAPAWSPDGSRIAFAGISNAGTMLWVIDAQGKLSFEGEIPGSKRGWPQCSWSRDGKRLALVARQTLHVFTSFEAPPRTVAVIPYPQSESATQPIWDEHDTTLVFCAGKAAWRVELASGTVSRLFGERTIADVVFAQESPLILGLEELEVEPSGIAAVAKVADSIASSGPPHESWQRTPLLLDPRDESVRELISSRSVGSERTLTRDAALPLSVRQAFARR